MSVIGGAILKVGVRLRVGIRVGIRVRMAVGMGVGLGVAEAVGKAVGLWNNQGGGFGGNGLNIQKKRFKRKESDKIIGQK